MGPTIVERVLGRVREYLEGARKVPSIKQCAPGKTHGSDYGGNSTGMCTRIFGRCAKSTKYKTVCTEDDSWDRLQREEYWDVYETIWKVRKARFLGALLQ